MLTYTYSDLIPWSQDLGDWQRDALRRLLRFGEFTDGDVLELADLACPEFSTQGGAPMADVATSEHVPTSGH